MHGLSTIKSINDEAVRQRTDGARRAKGQKPSDSASAITRQSRASRPVQFRTGVTAPTRSI